MSRSILVRPQRERAYTMIEVMVALAILTVGAAGVIALQKSAQVSNHNARMLTTANAVAMTWVERMRMDSMTWNNPGGIPDLASDTNWLNQVTNGTGWFTPQIVAGMASNKADILGADIFANDPAVPAFCTHVSLFPLYTGEIGVTIRTIWIRSGAPIDCTVDPTTVDSDPISRGKYGAVYYTTAVYNNVLPGG